MGDFVLSYFSEGWPYVIIAAIAFAVMFPLLWKFIYPHMMEALVMTFLVFVVSMGAYSYFSAVHKALEARESRAEGPAAEQASSASDRF